jgi:hypothetical protein
VIFDRAAGSEQVEQSQGVAGECGRKGPRQFGTDGFAGPATSNW